MYKIVFTGGGTAGHVVPNMAIFPYLKNEFECFYIGSEFGLEKNLVSPIMPYFNITTTKLVRHFTFKNFAIPHKLLKAYLEAKKILQSIMPDIVFSKGGYVSLPVIYAAHSLKIPVITHESDLTAGLANKLAAKYCKYVLTAYKETACSFKNGKFVGSPIRKELFSASRENALATLKLSGDKPILLIFGGSQGSAAINSVVKTSLSDLLCSYDVVHLVGKNNIDAKLKQLGYVQLEYFNDIGLLYKIASLVVSRAGANSLFEIVALKIPAVIIPLPKGNSRGDQVLNAEYFLKKGLVNVLYQETLTPDAFVSQINSTYANRFNMFNNMSAYALKDASKAISEIIKQQVKTP